MSPFDNRTIRVLETALDGASLKQRIIAHNMANVNTPKYKRYDVDFKEQLKNALGAMEKLPVKVTSNKHICNRVTLAEVEPRITRDTSTSMRADENNVDVDKEMSQMAQNAIYYNAAVTQLNKKLAILRYAISEGRR